MATAFLLALAFRGISAAPMPQAGGSSGGGSGGSGDGGASASSNVESGLPMTLTSGGTAYPTANLIGPEQNVPSITTESAAQPTYSLVANQEAEATIGLILDFSDDKNPQPIRGENGASDFTGFNSPYDSLNPDAFARPGTDAGDAPNFKWPMGLSTARSGTGGGNPGYARQQNVDELPISQSVSWDHYRRCVCGLTRL
jgi:hypothetical protein